MAFFLSYLFSFLSHFWYYFTLGYWNNNLLVTSIYWLHEGHSGILIVYLYDLRKLEGLNMYQVKYQVLKRFSNSPICELKIQRRKRRHLTNSCTAHVRGDTPWNFNFFWPSTEHKTIPFHVLSEPQQKTQKWRKHVLQSSKFLA